MMTKLLLRRGAGRVTDRPVVLLLLPALDATDRLDGIVVSARCNRQTRLRRRRRSMRPTDLSLSVLDVTDELDGVDVGA